MKILKTIGVLCLAVVLTTVAIDASDTLQGNSGTMLASLIGAQSSPCPSGMTHVPAALTFTCVDTYEAAASAECTVLEPANQFDTEVNIGKRNCEAVSEEGLKPWRFVTREQAQLLCTRAGKRLPSAAEWYQFAIGTPVPECNVSGAAVAAPAATACVSAAGAVHAVGNVWEWVSDDVINGQYNGRSVPSTGYVIQVDATGVATVTTEDSAADGYAWFADDGAYGMIRGGYYNSRNDAGVYTVHAATETTFKGEAIGFRCVQ